MFHDFWSILFLKVLVRYEEAECSLFFEDEMPRGKSYIHFGPLEFSSRKCLELTNDGKKELEKTKLNFV